MVNLALNLPYSHLSCLKINEQIIAAHFGLIFNNTFTFCVPSYDSRFAKYSPGRLLIYFLIKHCFDSRISYFDFGPGEETYKYEWSNNIVEGRSFIGNSVLEKLIRVYTRLGGKI
jgi:CelD/BcsL family acetyltransferase involved in cellulose biosynthesis